MDNKPVLNIFSSYLETSRRHSDSVHRCQEPQAVCEDNDSCFDFTGNLTNSSRLETPSYNQSWMHTSNEFNADGGHSSGFSFERFKGRVRTILKEEQLTILWDSFNKNPRPTFEEKHQIAELTSLSFKVVKIWFQNKRRLQKIKNSMSQSH